jgi:hypothetical protein
LRSLALFRGTHLGGFLTCLMIVTTVRPSCILSLLRGTMPVFIEICKRSARFISSYLNSRSALWFSLLLGMILALLAIISVLGEMPYLVVTSLRGNYLTF